MTAMRSKSYTALQKTYDQCYLTCSTAIFYETQGNEPEALRCWRECLNQIQCHNATYRSGGSWRGARTKTDTEKTLEHALKSMELQCQERMDLLEALNLSRAEASKTETSKLGTGGQNSLLSAGPIRRESDGQTNQLSMPSPSAFGGKDLPPSLPPRPDQPQHQSSQRRPQLHSSPVGSSGSGKSIKPAIAPPQLVYPKLGRTSSPEKSTGFVQTLRTKKPTRKGYSGGPEEGATAAKAATLAWGSLRGEAPILERTRSGTAIEGLSSRDRSETAQQATKSTSDLTDRNLVRAQTSNVLSSTSSQNLVLPRPRPRPFSTLIPSNKVSPQLFDIRPEVEASVRPNTAQAFPHLRPPTNQSSVRRRSLDIERKPVPNTYKSQLPEVPPVPPKHLILHTSISKPVTESPQTSQKESETFPAVDTDSNALSPRKSKESLNKKEKEASASEGGETEGLEEEPETEEERAWSQRVKKALKQIHKGVDEHAVLQILKEIVVKGDEVHWDDVAGLETAKLALKEAVVYPFLRPDLFSGLREPARGMLLFGPPGTGKTMIARAVATESKSTFFSISASSLTSKYLGESEKLVRALFALAKALAPSIIFVDEIDSLLSSRSSGENEATRRIKTEFLIQWSDLQKAAAGKDTTIGDPSRVLVLAATNLPWAIDEAARRRFVRRQYIPLPEAETRRKQLEGLLSHQKHDLREEDKERLMELTEGFSGSDMTALAKDAAMGPLRSLGEALLQMKMEQIRPICFEDFERSLVSIRPSVSPEGLEQFETWAKQFGERV